MVTTFQDTIQSLSCLLVYDNHLLSLDAGQKGNHGSSYDLSKFILVKLEYVEDDRASAILQRSSGFCKIPITWKFNTLVALTDDAEVE